MMKKLRFTYLLSILLAFGVMSCSDDDPTPADEEETPVDIADPDAVAEALTFGNGTATVVKEAFPEPSADASAPILPTPNDEEVVGISGGNLILDLYTLNGINAKGVYLQVDGADQYHDIVLNEDTNSNGRFFNSRKSAARTLRSAKAQEENMLILTLPDGLASGNFCITYAVYDDENRVSNAIKLCIEVKSDGGENSNFLTANEWAMEMEFYREIYQGETYQDTTVVGQIYEHTNQETFTCPEETQSKDVTFNDLYRLDYTYINFEKDGSLTMEEKDSGKQLDIDATCETGEAQIIDDIDVFEYTGSWSYDDSKKELSLILQYTENSIAMPADGGEPIVTEEIETDYEVYQVSQENGKLIFTQTETEEWGSSDETKIFVPKN